MSAVASASGVPRHQSEVVSNAKNTVELDQAASWHIELALLLTLEPGWEQCDST